jgi:hypothetical protein
MSGSPCGVKRGEVEPEDLSGIVQLERLLNARLLAVKRII